MSENRSAWTCPPGYWAQHVQRPHNARREICSGGPQYGPPVCRRQAVAEVGGAHTSEEAGQRRSSKGALVRCVSQRVVRAGIGMSLRTPPKLQGLRAALYHKAKCEPNYRFYALYDKVWRMDMLAHAYALNRQNDGAPGVDGQTFADIEAYGVEQWLAELQEELRTERYRPLPVRR